MLQLVKQRWRRVSSAPLAPIGVVSDPAEVRIPVEVERLSGRIAAGIRIRRCQLMPRL